VPEGGTNSIRRLGDILNYGKLYMAGQVGVAQSAGSVSQNSANTDIVLYHVYGDPTMKMWTSNPWFIRLPKLYYIEKFDPNIWQIRYPVEGAEITLLQDGNPVARSAARNGMAFLTLLGDFDPEKGYQLSASVPGGMSTLLETSQNQGEVNPEQGGTVKDETGRIQLQFPAGAVEETTTIFLADVSDETLNDNQVRRFVLEGVDANGEVIRFFDTAYTMELRYTDEELAEAGLDESSLHCAWLDETENVWKQVESSVDTENNIVTCQVDHFTQFAMSGETAPADGNQIFLPLLTR
jgi:hypothetical protein